MSKKTKSILMGIFMLVAGCLAFTENWMIMGVLPVPGWLLGIVFIGVGAGEFYSAFFKNK